MFHNVKFESDVRVKQTLQTLLNDHWVVNARILSSAEVER
jgi:hypothetical protein